MGSGPGGLALLAVTALAVILLTTGPARRRIGLRRSSTPKRRRKWLRYGIVGLALTGALATWITDRRDASVLLSWLVAVNVVAFAFYGWDKLTVHLVVSRVPERTLYLLAAAGGSVGALVAQQVFRHKVSDTRFQLTFWSVVLVQVAVVSLYVRSGSTPT